MKSIEFLFFSEKVSSFRENRGAYRQGWGCASRPENHRFFTPGLGTATGSIKMRSKHDFPNPLIMLVNLDIRFFFQLLLVAKISPPQKSSLFCRQLVVYMQTTCRQRPVDDENVRYRRSQTFVLAGVPRYDEYCNGTDRQHPTRTISMFSVNHRFMQSICSQQMQTTCRQQVVYMQTTSCLQVVYMQTTSCLHLSTSYLHLLTTC